MTATNDITGDQIKSGKVTDTYRDNWDKIFGKKDVSKEQQDNKPVDTEDKPV